MTHSLRSLEAAVLQAETAVARKAPPEVTGDGALFPALVIGVGAVGLTVLQRLRENLHRRFGSLANAPHLRLLLLDTDPEVVRTATTGRPGAALSGSDVLLAPLNRPSYYLKPRDGRPGLGDWLNPKMLYRIPRSQMTTGVRALGRLAFCDNYRTIVRRLQMELDACLDPAALQTAARQSRLGVRTNRPRVYVVANLAGGTGGGVFLDLAYTLRAMLRQMGYAQPDVVGVLLLPPVDRCRTRVLPLGNAYAALAELSHYASPDIGIQGQVPRARGADPGRRPAVRPLLPAAAARRGRRHGQPRIGGPGGAAPLPRPLFAAGQGGRPGPGRAGGAAVAVARPVLPDVRPVPPGLAAARPVAGGRPPALPSAAPALDEQGQQAAPRRRAGAASRRRGRGTTSARNR